MQAIHSASFLLSNILIQDDGGLYIRRCIKDGSPLNDVVPGTGITPLRYAAIRGDEALLRAILEHTTATGDESFDVDEAGDDGLTALHLVCSPACPVEDESQAVRIVTLLLQHKASLTARNVDTFFSSNPTVCNSGSGDLSVVNVYVAGGRSALFFACEAGVSLYSLCRDRRQRLFLAHGYAGLNNPFPLSRIVK